MIWNRQYYGTNQTAWVLRFISLCLVMSLIFTQYIAAGTFGFLGTIAVFQTFYFKRVGQALTFKNDKKRGRMLQGGHSNWELTFENKGFPIWNGQLRLQFQDSVKPRFHNAFYHSQLIEVLVPFTIGSNEKVTIHVPLEGLKRGVSRLKQLEVTIPQLFGEGSVVLLHTPMLRKEQMVYPNIHKIHELRKPSAVKPGDFEYKHSIFQDVFSPIGTRDYLPSDQFHHIHWKASARLQKFQTKVFTQVANESVLLVLNVAHRYSIIADLEEKIELVASFADYFYREGIPYSIAINVRAFGRSPYLFLPTSDGQIQRQKMMELLSVLTKDDLTMPIKRMLAHMDMHVNLPMAVIVFTHDDLEIASFVAKWRKQAHVEVFGGIEVGGEKNGKNYSFNSIY